MAGRLLYNPGICVPTALLTKIASEHMSYVQAICHFPSWPFCIISSAGRHEGMSKISWSTKQGNPCYVTQRKHRAGTQDPVQVCRR
jgi:hypothetical protein